MNHSKKIGVALLPNCQITPASSADQAAIVIDTLRFTTTAVQAMQSGAKSIHVVQDIAVALAYADRLGPGVKLCGERECRPIEGFDFGNSPLEYTSNVVLGQDLIFSTTNGTRAVETTQLFAHCLLAALVNRTAVAQAVQRSKIESWQIVCAGTDGQVAGEDVLTAGAIIEALLADSKTLLTNDAARLALMLWQSVWNQKNLSGEANHLMPILESFLGGHNLVQAGYLADVQFACQLDILNAVPARGKHDQFFRALSF